MSKKTLLKNKFRYGIKNKIVLFFTIFTIIPLCIVGFVSYSTTNLTVTEVLSKYIEQTTQVLNTRVSTLFNEAISILNLASDYKTKLFLKSTTEQELYNASKDMGNLYSNMRQVNKFSDNIMDVTIVGANGNCVSERSGFYHLKKPFHEYLITKTVLIDPRNVHIFGDPQAFHDYPPKNNVISMATSIFKIGTNEAYGIILVDIEKSALMDIFSEAKWSDKSFVSIIDADGTPILQNAMLNSSGISQKNIDAVINQRQSNGNFFDTINGHRFLFVYNTLQSTRWKIVVAVPENEILAPVRNIRNIIFAGIFLSLLLVWLINTIISNSLVAPISGLKKLMKQASSGDLDVAVKYNGKDEISELYESFDKMVKKIKHLMEAQIQEQHNLKVSEFKALQAQINPHFLYNTLDSVVRVAESNKINEVIDLTIELSHFYKAVLSKNDDILTLSYELEHAQSYLKIMKLRYHDILDYEFFVDNRALNCKFPRIILQPIIENAIYHGIKNTLKAGKVEIYINLLEEKHLSITIKDNGIGIKEEKLMLLQKNIQGSMQSSSDSYGLKNINQRIRLFFGEHYGIEIDSEYNTGTVVRMIVPAIMI